jgi:hypothetical protein
VVEQKKPYIRSIGNQLPQKDLLVTIESVDNETKQLVNLRLEGKCLDISRWRRTSLMLTSLMLTSLLIFSNDCHCYKKKAAESLT